MQVIGIISHRLKACKGNRGKRTNSKRTQKAVANAAKMPRKDSGDLYTLTRNCFIVMPSEKSVMCLLIGERGVAKQLCCIYLYISLL